MIDVLLMFINKIKKLIGSTTDTGGGASAGTIMGKLNNITSKTDSIYSWVNTILGRTGNANDTGGTSTAGTVMAKLNYLVTQIGNYLSNINTYSSRIGSTTDTGGSSTAGTVMGKLNNLMAASGSIKSIQRGTFSFSYGDNAITISAINPSKTMCNILGGVNVQGETQQIYVKSLTSTKLTVSGSIEGLGNGYKGSYELIEFY